MSIKQIIPADRWYAEYRRPKHIPGLPMEYKKPVVCFALSDLGEDESAVWPMVWDEETDEIVYADSLKEYQKLGRYDE